MWAWRGIIFVYHRCRKEKSIILWPSLLPFPTGHTVFLCVAYNLFLVTLSLEYDIVFYKSLYTYLA